MSTLFSRFIIIIIILIRNNFDYSENRELFAVSFDLLHLSQQLMKDSTAKINMAKPKKPFERTRQGTPFHISLEMHKNHSKGRASDFSYDIYAFGVLLWVLCEGSGNRRPQAYDKYCTRAAMKLAVEKEIYPERPLNATEACWELMTKCWHQRCVLTANDLCREMENILSIQ